MKNTIIFSAKQASNYILDFIMDPILDRLIKPDIPNGFCPVVINGIYVSDDSKVCLDPLGG